MWNRTGIGGSFQAPDQGEADSVWLQHILWLLGKAEVYSLLLAAILAFTVFAAIKLSRAFFTDFVSRGYLWLVIIILLVGGFNLYQLERHASSERFHDTFFVVATFRHLIMSVVVPIGLAISFAALKKSYNRTLGRVQFAAFSLGCCLTKIPEFFIVPQSMPRRYVDYQASYDIWNRVSEAGYLLFAISILLFLVLLALSLRGRHKTKRSPDP